MRIVKTGISVFFCLLLNYLFSAEVALYSSLAAITTMQATLESTVRTSVVELVGTALGGAVGMAILPLATTIDIEWLYVTIMPVGMILVIYVCVLIKMPQAASLCGFVYIAVLVAPYDSSSNISPYLPALYRMTDTTVGVVIALVVNRFIAPPRPPAPKNVHVPTNTFSSIIERVQSKLTDEEQLILVDTGLLRPEMRRPRLRQKHSGFPVSVCHDSVSIPVPMEFAKEDTVDGAYIALDYAVTPFTLIPHDGYVDLPCEAYPATVMWRVTPPKGRETYGIVHPHHGGGSAGSPQKPHRGKAVARGARHGSDKRENASPTGGASSEPKSS